MKFKPLFPILVSLSVLAWTVTAAPAFHGGLGELANLAAKGGQQPEASQPKMQLSQEMDLSDLSTDMFGTSNTGLFDRYKIPAKKEAQKEVKTQPMQMAPPHNNPPTRTLPQTVHSERQTFQNPQPPQESSAFSMDMANELREDNWKMSALKNRDRLRTENDDAPPRTVTHTDAPELPDAPTFQTPLSLQTNAESMSGRLHNSLEDLSKPTDSPAIASLQAKLTGSVPRELPVTPNPEQTLQATYKKLFDEYLAENGALQALKKKYQSEKEFRNREEKNYENLRDSLQFQAHELAQDLTVAKIDASDLLKTLASAKKKVEELKGLEKQQADHVELLQRKHQYITGAYELLQGRQKEIEAKKSALAAQKAELEASEKTYQEKVRNLRAEMDRLGMHTDAVEQTKAKLEESRQMLKKQKQAMKERSLARESLKGDMAQRKAAVEDARKRLAALKEECAGKMKQVMDKIRELEEVKTANTEKVKLLSKESEALEFEKSKLGEKLGLLAKKERILRQRESDYQVKEGICHCRRLKQLSEEEMMVVNPFRVVEAQQETPMPLRMEPMMQAMFGGAMGGPVGMPIGAPVGGPMGANMGLPGPGMGPMGGLGPMMMPMSGSGPGIPVPPMSQRMGYV